MLRGFSGENARCFGQTSVITLPTISAGALPVRATVADTFDVAADRDDGEASRNSIHGDDAVHIVAGPFVNGALL